MNTRSLYLPAEGRRILAGCLLASVLVACSSNTDESVEAPAGDPSAQKSAFPDEATAAKAAQTGAADGPEQKVVEAFTVGRDVYVRAIAVDEAAGTVWVGTSAGVLEVDLASRDMRNVYTRDAGLANEYVFAIHVDKAGRKWFGTNGGGITRYADGQWKTYFPMHGLADYWVYSFGEAGDDLWIGTWNGANRFDAASETFQTYVQELVNEWVYGIAVDSSERVWLGTEAGISMFDGEQWHGWTHKDGIGAPNHESLPVSTNTGLGTRSRHDLSVTENGQPTYNPGYVFAVLADAQDRIWAGTWGGGVSYYDAGRWHSLTEKDGLAGNIVFSVAQDEAGVYWFGTNKGLSRYDGTHWRTYGRADGLVDDHVYAVAPAADGQIWVGTRNGVAWLAYPAQDNSAAKQ